MLHKVLEGLVVGEDNHVAVDKIATPFAQSLDDCKQLPLVDRPARFGRRKTLAKVADGHVLPSMLLHKDAANSCITSIHMNRERLIK